jgi:hypothetical protein
MTYTSPHPRESNWKVMIKKECWAGIRILMMPAQGFKSVPNLKKLEGHY